MRIGSIPPLCRSGAGAAVFGDKSLNCSASGYGVRCNGQFDSSGKAGHNCEARRDVGPQNTKCGFVTERYRSAGLRYCESAKWNGDQDPRRCGDAASRGGASVGVKDG